MQPHEEEANVYASGEAWSKISTAYKDMANFERLGVLVTYCLRTKDRDLCDALFATSRKRTHEKLFPKSETKVLFPEYCDVFSEQCSAAKQPKGSHQEAQGSCPNDHNDPTNYVSCIYACFFDPTKANRKFENGRCWKCNEGKNDGDYELIPWIGDSKPSLRKPVYVCSFLDKKVALGCKKCFDTAFLCQTHFTDMQNVRSAHESRASRRKRNGGG